MNNIFQESLFSKSKDNKRILDIVKVDFVESQSMTWQELFSGFDRIYAITYSSTMSFIWEVLELFEYGEIIFGHEPIISYEIQEIFACQIATIERINETTELSKFDLVNRVEDESLKLFVAKEQLSHEKIYLLESNDNKYRVIMGSANMSYAAFKGIQRENITYIDGIEGFNWYKEKFDELKEKSSNDISKESLLTNDLEDNIDKLPISNEVKIKKVVIINPNSKDIDDIKFTLKVENLIKKYKKSSPIADKDGKVRLNPEKINTFKRKIIDNKVLEQEQSSEYPSLVINVDNKLVSLNGNVLDLSPDKNDIKKDVELFLQYMDGFTKFHGNITELQNKYYSFAVWFFTSPFMALFRDYAIRYNRNILPYPIFGLLYGKSKAGKTKFLETLLKMMIGQKTKMNAPDFTRTNINGLRSAVKGAPIIVDDLNKSRFDTHAIETIKNDDFGIGDNNIHYPAVVISANEDVKAVAPEITRRTVICHVQAGLTNKEIMKDRIVRKVQSNIGTALYREFLGRVIERTPELIKEIQDEDIDEAVDLLEEASHILYDILKENYEEDLPSYIRLLSLEDFFGEKATSSQAIETIKTAWANNRESFVYNKKQSTISYDASANYEAERILKELPENLEAKRSRAKIILNINKASEFFEIDFKKGFGIFSKIRK